jgi:integrase
MARSDKRRINTTLIESLEGAENEYTVRDDNLPGFGVRVRPTGATSFVFTYRAGKGRGSTVRRYTIGDVRKMAPEQARKEAKRLLGLVASGHDPVAEQAAQPAGIPIAELAARFMAEHTEAKRKARTAEFYRDILDRIVVPQFGSKAADKVTRAEVAKLHHELRQTPFQANRVLAVIGSMYTFADRIGLVPEGFNPSRRIEKYKETRRERFLDANELDRLGNTLREAETVGLPWQVDETKPRSKHLPKEHRTKIDPFAIAAIRLLILTGARLREILHLKWEHVDLERGLLLLPDSKTGRKTIILNAPAKSVLAALHRVGAYVIVGKSAGKPRADLHRPWRAIAKHAELEGVRIHDLRHTHASIGAASGMGLPIIGKLLGHTHASTTQRYAHLDNDPLKKASEHIGNEIARQMGEKTDDNSRTVEQFRKTAG